MPKWHVSRKSWISGSCGIVLLCASKMTRTASKLVDESVQNKSSEAWKARLRAVVCSCGSSAQHFGNCRCSVMLVHFAMEAFLDRTEIVQSLWKLHRLWLVWLDCHRLWVYQAPFCKDSKASSSRSPLWPIHVSQEIPSPSSYGQPGKEFSKTIRLALFWISN